MTVFSNFSISFEFYFTLFQNNDYSSRQIIVDLQSIENLQTIQGVEN